MQQLSPTVTDVPTRELIRELAGLTPGSPVLSIYLRTDPREPVNTNHHPGWLVTLRNGLRDVSHRLEQEGSREDRLAWRELAPLVERELEGLPPAERARGVAWFHSLDGSSVNRRLALQVPPRAGLVRWDERPFISPLVDVADRGRPTGIVLIAGDAVRLLHWEAGVMSEPSSSLYELELGDWREYSAYASANPARGQQTATNTEAYGDRVDEWRARFHRTAAQAVGARLGELGWDRVVLLGEGSLASEFAELLADDARARVVETAEGNLLWAEPGAVAEHLEDLFLQIWRRAARAKAERAIAASQAGGAGAAGWPEVLDLLAQSRVEHLFFAGSDPVELELPAPTFEALGRPTPELLVERAVETAVASGAEVTAVADDDAELLTEVGGAAASLRY